MFARLCRRSSARRNADQAGKKGVGQSWEVAATPTARPAAQSRRPPAATGRNLAYLVAMRDAERTVLKHLLRRAVLGHTEKQVNARKPGTLARVRLGYRASVRRNRQ
jgi:hypothetical protein